MENKYRSVAHIRWELPFPILLPSQVYFCWEPKEGIAAFVPEGRVGSICWKRTCHLLSPEAVFDERPSAQDPNLFSPHDYKLASVSSKLKKRVFTAELLHGPDGGFIEARPYTVANVFLCISPSGSINDIDITIRANAALNNIIDLYRILSMDPLLRPIKDEGDHYYTIISEAVLPGVLQCLLPQEILLHINELQFSGKVGEGRINKIGLNSYEDLKGLKISPQNLIFFNDAIKSAHQLELFYQLIFSSVRRLKRKEGALAIIDAQSAFESAVASMLRDGLSSEKWGDKEIEKAFAYGGDLHLLSKRLQKIDDVSKKFTKAKFRGSVAEIEWRRNLYDVRNEIVHGGKRTVFFEEAKAGIVSGLKAIRYLHDLCPLFARKFMWSGESLELRHIQKTAGRLSRIFEA
jgi:hypothetical protein